MKNTIKNHTPNWLFNVYKRLKGHKYKNMPIDEVFSNIYKNNEWNSKESVSGLGSELEQTKTLRVHLEKLINEREISTVLDIPCGDFLWMQKVNLSNAHYIGVDIVEDIIKANQDQHKSENLEFRVLNLIKDPLPKTDLVIVRDCLVHLSYKDIFAALQNLKASGCKYLLTTTFVGRKSNHDISTGDWRTLNLEKAPFNLPKPLLIINENCTEASGVFSDKSMALWEISNI
jgi:cyclopropane fatty-acyl-phospholipid synthase-like methyltransferase